MDKQVFGVENIEVYIEEMKKSIMWRVSGKNMMITSILSDAQEWMERGDTEAARKLMNIAKYIVNEVEE